LAASRINRGFQESPIGCLPVGIDLRASWDERRDKEIYLQECHVKALEDLQADFYEGFYGV
jgi:hypothetical protein